ncbi:hypothetical protein V6N13_074690 [Hibiscus sabdariffa]|uniref:HMA domain-containing protein n=1 Tax=Hibiscus sabdariffa TaxID=183260 RepID=A0ABR2U9K6_9ROSI
MKQKIVLKVSMHCSKCRTKALKVAAVAYGVISVALEGAEKDKLVIIGDGVDAACLTEALRKKLCHASIEIVEEVKDPKPEKKEDKKELCICWPPHQVEYYRVVPDPAPAPCTIM